MGNALLIRGRDSSTIEGASLLDSVRIGDMIESAKTITDSRFVKCSGQEVYSTVYPSLYSAIPSRYYSEASSTGWNSFTESTDAVVYKIGDLYFKKESSNSYWQYSEDGSSNWTNLPYTGKPYYTCGIYMLDSGYVCKSTSNLKSGTWTKVNFTISTSSIPSDEVTSPASCMGYGEDCPYSAVLCGYDICENFVLISYKYEASGTGYAGEDAEDYSYDEYSWVKYRIMSIDANSLFSSVNETSGTTIFSEDGSCIVYNAASMDESSTTYDGTLVQDSIVSKNGDIIMIKCNDSYRFYNTDTTESTPNSTALLDSSDGSYGFGNGYYDPTKTVFWHNGGYSYEYAPTVYANGKSISLPMENSKHIYAMGYASITNCIIYITNYKDKSSSWKTYSYSLDTGTSTYICDYPSTTNIGSGRYTFYHDDSDGHVYHDGPYVTYKLLYKTLKKYTLPTQSSNSEVEYMKVSN